jgi:hypothetical protein
MQFNLNIVKQKRKPILDDPYVYIFDKIKSRSLSSKAKKVFKVTKHLHFNQKLFYMFIENMQQINY